MTTKTPTVELVNARSHWIELGHYDVVEREEVTLTFATEWRGTPVTVQVTCDRYSAGMSAAAKTMGPWRIIARTPYERTDEEWRQGSACTETARQRLRPLVEPLAEAWLDSPAYRLSEGAAYRFAILRELREASPTYSDPTERTRTAIRRHGDKLNPGDRERVMAACDAFDAYAAAFTEANDA